jgi:hypothetical protein
MRIETYRCDVCGVEKREANHWWWLAWNEGYKRALLLSAAVRAQRFSEDDSIAYVRFDLCGEACVVKKLAEFMGRVQSLVAQPAAPVREARTA